MAHEEILSAARLITKFLYAIIFTFVAGIVTLLTLCCYSIRMSLSLKLLKQRQALQQAQQQVQQQQVQQQPSAPQSAFFSRTDDATLLNISVE